MSESPVNSSPFQNGGNVPEERAAPPSLLHGLHSLLGGEGPGREGGRLLENELLKSNRSVKTQTGAKPVPKQVYFGDFILLGRKIESQDLHIHQSVGA
jgi:hypothetical protein